MQRRKIRNRLCSATLLAIVLVSASLPARAASKEMIELQTQVQQLLDMMQRIQSTLDTRFGVLQNLAQQTSDNATQMSAAVSALQKKIDAQSEAAGGKLDTTSGQIQSLTDSVDELKSRIAKLDKSIQDLQTQLQNAQTPPANPSANGAPPPSGAPPSGLGAVTPGGPAAIPTINQTPPLQETFQAGVRDLNAARYDVATGEFQDVIHYYPLDDLAGQAQFYLGEIAYRQQNYAAAVKSYNAVLEGFSGSPKAAAAQLRKGFALLLLGKRQDGIHELRVLVQRHPQTPEAAQARTKLASLGATKPSAAR
jgi:TolA-binding protein